MQNYDILHKIANDVVLYVSDINYNISDKKFIKSIPIYYSSKLYYQSIYFDNDYIISQPIMSSLLQRGATVYNMIYNMYKPRNITLSNTNIVALHKRTKQIIWDIGKYNWFDMCVNTRQIKTIIYDDNLRWDAEGNVYLPNIQNNLDSWLL